MSVRIETILNTNDWNFIKTCEQTEIRKFMFEINNKNSFDILHNKINNNYKSLSIKYYWESFVVYWKDQRNQRVMIVNDETANFALSYHQRNNIDMK